MCAYFRKEILDNLKVELQSKLKIVIVIDIYSDTNFIPRVSIAMSFNIVTSAM